MSTLERAIEIAARAHAGTVDKAGAPYVLHPIRVMLQMTTEEERIVGVLHDVVEDTSWSFEKLRDEGFSEVVITALRAVTKLPEDEDQPGDDGEQKRERYFRFVSRAARNPIGRLVKLADLRDNCDLSRIRQPTERDRARIAKYKDAIAMLEKEEQGAE